jgi:hypothetical protein
MPSLDTMGPSVAGTWRDAHGGDLEMSYWWDGDAHERFWVEIRHVPGIGESVWTSTRDRAGRRNPWWDLVGSVRAGEVIYHYSKRERRFRWPEHRVS